MKIRRNMIMGSANPANIASLVAAGEITKEQGEKMKLDAAKKSARKTK